jgi:ParB family chromosome partitioning protein
MAKKTSGLGRGLGALGLEENSESNATIGENLQISIYDIDTNPNQPRKIFNEKAIEELSESIKQHGIIQPILVKQKGNRFLIIAGERRFRAAKRAGIDKVPVIISDLNEQDITEVALIENIQRENLNPIEEANAYRFLMEQHDLSQEEVSRRVGKSRSAITNSLRLLDLSEEVIKNIEGGELSAGHGKMLAGITDAEKQRKIAETSQKEGWSVRQLEDYLRGQNEKKREKKAKPNHNSEIEQIEYRLKEKLQTFVSIKGNSKKGKIEISFSSQEELERLLEELINK